MTLLLYFQLHEARKAQLMHHALTNRKEKSESQEKMFADKFQKRFADMAKREHEDHLRQFQVLYLGTIRTPARIVHVVKTIHFKLPRVYRGIRRLFV